MGMLRSPAIRHGRGRGDEKRGADEVSAPLWRVLVSRSHSTKRQVILLSSFSKFIAAPSRGRPGKFEPTGLAGLR